MTPPKVSVVIALFHDEATLPLLWQRLSAYLRAQSLSYEVILVDDGSPDRTAALLAELAAQHEELIGLAMERNVGQARAVAAGLAVARGDVVVTLDSDLETGLEVIPRLASAIDHGAELACGRRAGRDPVLHRRLGSTFANALAQLLFRVRIRDFGCGTNAGSRALLDRWLAAPYGAAFLKLALLRVAERVVEVDIDLRAIPDEERLTSRLEPPLMSRYRLWALIRQVLGLLWFRLHPRQLQRSAAVRRLGERTDASAGAADRSS